MIKKIKQIFAFIANLMHSIFFKDYQWYIVSDEPPVIKGKTIFIIKDGIEPDTLLFKCPCGCKSLIHLNLLPDAKPKWNFQIKSKNKLTITPSIWRTTGCKSHFFIRNNRIVWA
jgi:hypothetical protein